MRFVGFLACHISYRTKAKPRHSSGTSINAEQIGSYDMSMKGKARASPPPDAQLSVEDAKAAAEAERAAAEARKRSFERSLAGPSVGKAGLMRDQTGQ